MKKLVSILLCLVLCMGLCGVTALASSDGPSTPAPGEPMEGPSASNEMTEDMVFATVPPVGGEEAAAAPAVEIPAVQSGPSDILLVVALCVVAAAAVMAVAAVVVVIKGKKNG